MSDVTTVEGITVVGQRRVASGLGFPIRPSGGGGGGGTSGGEEENTLPDDPNWGQPELLVQDPCANPASALAWNADAAAAAAAKEFARRAAALVPPEDLNGREWGAYLYRQPDGTVRVGPVNPGPPFSSGGLGTVELIEDGSPSDIIGFVHSHASGNHLPSDGSLEQPGDIQVLDAVAAYSGNPAVRMYIVAPNQGPAGHTPYNQINYYDASNARSARDTFTSGPEVNPEGMPCQG